MEILTAGLAALAVVLSLVCCILVARQGRGGPKTDGESAQLRQELQQLRSELAEQARQGRQENTQIVQQLRGEMAEQSRLGRQENAESMQKSIQSLGQLLSGSQSRSSQELMQRQETLQTTLQNLIHNFTLQNEQKMENIRATMEKSLAAMQADNGRRLEQMRATVDEKLQKTLEERIGQSFKLVNERLEQVYKGLGEMQTLAAGVGDLKKVLSNVKTRGTLGEIQLGSILEEMLSPGQYECNVATKKGSQNRVEFAIRLPGDGDAAVYLPIDAKFPADAYTHLLDAYDSGDSTAVEMAAKVLEGRIKQFGRDIHERYIDPPGTTDFAIMFLPVEGLYAEVVRRGLVEVLQREYKISIAGPTTMAALLNSLQMGFRTLAIQKRSSEVWQVLGAVKTEFEKFADVLDAARSRLEQADKELEKLVGTRTRVIQRKLREVSTLPEEQSQLLLGDGEEE